MISPADGQKYAAQIRAVYDQAELLVIQKIADRVAKDGGIADDHWLMRKQAEIARNKAEITKIMNKFAVDGPKAIQDLITQGYLSGVLSADGDLIDAGAKMVEKPISFKPAKLGEPVSVTGTFGAIHTSAIHSLVAATQGGLSGAHVMMVRQAQDAYSNIIAKIAPNAVAGIETRQQATQRALIDFADKGIGAFTDRTGKNWDIATYAEMATRTGMAQAHIQGHINRMTEQGYDLVIVSHHPEPSRLCAPHEGKVYSISGNDNRYPSLQSAIATGLFHPNCRHTINAYIEGLTDEPKIEADPDGYDKRQKQRYYERQVRYWKKRQIVSITPKEKALTDAKVKQWSQVLNKYVKGTGGIRDYSRTRVYKDTIGKGSASTGKIPTINPAAEVKTIVKDATAEVKKDATSVSATIAGTVDIKKDAEYFRLTGVPKDTAQQIQDRLNRVFDKIPLLRKKLSSLSFRVKDLGEGTYAKTSSIDMTLSKPWFTNPQKFAESYTKDLIVGHHPQGTDFLSTLTHEMGHILAKAADIADIASDLPMPNKGMVDRVIGRVLDELGMKPSDMRTELSKYAMTNNSEAFAEAFSEWMDSPSPRPFAKKFGEVLEQELKRYDPSAPDRQPEQ